MSQVSTGRQRIRTAVMAYIVGFILSIGLTLVPFIFVQQHIDSHHTILSHGTLFFILIAFAVVQLIVQLVFFLHLGQESRPRWNLLAFLFMLVVLVIVVGGSLWIMKNLNYHMMTPEETNAYMHDNEGL